MTGVDLDHQLREMVLDGPIDLTQPLPGESELKARAESLRHHPSNIHRLAAVELPQPVNKWEVYWREVRRREALRRG